MLPSKPANLIALLGLGAIALILAFSLRQGVEASGPYPEMAVDCDVAAPGVQSQCQYEVGETFGVTVDLAKPPAEGYIALQTKLRWEHAALAYVAAAEAISEFSWPGCVIAARSEGPDDWDGEASALHGCSAGVSLTPSDYAGPVLRLQFRCSGPGSSPLSLVQSHIDSQLGSHVLDRIQQIVDPTLRGAIVGCGAPPVGDPSYWDPSMAPPYPLRLPARGNGTMALDCDDFGPGVQRFCAYDVGRTFLVDIVVANLPVNEGAARLEPNYLPYEGFGVKIAWSDGLDVHLSSATTGVVAPGCSASSWAPASSTHPVTGADHDGASWSCAFGERSIQTGVVLRVAMTCQGRGRPNWGLSPSWAT
jgi:hypothetical protein